MREFVMTFKTALLRSVALSATATIAMGAAAHAETVKHKHHKAAVKAEAGAGAQTQTNEEIRILRSEIEALKARLDAQGQAQQAVAAQAAQTQSQVAEVAANAQSAQDKIETIPEQVNVAIAELPKPKSDAIYVKGVKITLGGFIEAAGIYRSKNTGADIASSFTAIPYSGPGSTATSAPGNAASVGHTQELRFTARQSRISALIEGDYNPDTHLAAYGEFDFNSAAQTANSNESNSYNLRIRNLYTTLDKTDLGLHLLAGQNWSLATMNSKGITPRNELTPPQIDAQYIPGFVWTRQPQIRLADQLTPELWIAASVENPQTTFAGGATAPGAALRVIYSEAAGSGFNSANTLSLNHIPDVIAKVAYEPTVAGRQVHLEAFGLFRSYYERMAAGITVNAPVAPSTLSTITESATANVNQNIYGGGVGFGVTIQAIPKVLDLQLSGLFGDGIGRYGSSQLPDVTVKYNGNVTPIRETMFLAGATYHFNPAIDFYAFAGQEQEQRQTWTFNGTGYGLGSPLYSNVACFGEASAGSCTGQTRTIEQATFGLWDKVYQGKIGQFRVGAQYSWTERKAFLGVGGAPSTTDNMIFLSVRYYPFQ
jgi:TolA-binding protein